MSQPNAMTEAEQVTTVVFGDTFALYDEDEFDEFIEPLLERLAANGIDRDVFRGARCLDAGCGGGRASVMMAQLGAAEVVGYDLSGRNVETARARAAHRGLDQCTFVQGSLLEIPFEDESFDVVWCNGVLHHTEDPDLGLREIARVLKPGGHMWLYLYGSGGIYWYMVDWVRALLAGHDVRRCIYQLRLLGMPTRRIAEWIDDWFSPFLRRYTNADVAARLDELGFSNTQLRSGGTVYDTSQRRVEAESRETELMGEGDLRYWADKSGGVSGDAHALPDPPDGKGSPFDDPVSVTTFSAALDRIRSAVEAVEERHGGEGRLYRVAVARSVHAKVRDLLETEADFDTNALDAHLEDLERTLLDFAATD